MVAQVLIDAEVRARSVLSDLSVAKSLPYVHPWRSVRGGPLVHAAGRRRDEPTVPSRKGALTCGGQHYEQATSAVLGPERSEAGERPA